MTYPDPTQSWPVQQPGPQQQASPSKTPVVVLAVLAVLVAVAAGLFTVFYFSAQGEVDRIATAQATSDADVKRADERLERAESDAEAAQSELTKAKNKGTSLKSERDKLATCTDAAGRYLDTKPDTPQRDEWFKKMLERCRYL